MACCEHLNLCYADDSDQNDIADMDGETMMQNLGYEPPGAKASTHKRKAADSSQAESSKANRK